MGSVSEALTWSGERRGARLDFSSSCSPKSASLLVAEEAELTSSCFSRTENKRRVAVWKEKKWDMGKWELAVNEGS